MPSPLTTVYILCNNCIVAFKGLKEEHDEPSELEQQPPELNLEQPGLIMYTYRNGGQRKRYIFGEPQEITHQQPTRCVVDDIQVRPLPYLWISHSATETTEVRSHNIHCLLFIIIHISLSGTEPARSSRSDQQRNCR